MSNCAEESFTIVIGYLVRYQHLMVSSGHFLLCSFIGLERNRIVTDGRFDSYQ